MQTGVSHDEAIEQANWKINFAAIKDVFGNNDNAYSILINHKSKYYGVGFNFISQIYLFLMGSVIKFKFFSEEISKILLNHSFIFVTFFISGLFARKIINLSIKDKFYSNFFLIFYLLYPYLIGHGFYNPKDMPFLFAWILSTYLSIRIFLNIYNKKNISYPNIFLLALSTAFLFSIRISGILIFIQYLFIFIITFLLIREPFYKMIKTYYLKIIFFIIMTLMITIIFYPVFWKNPFLIFTSIYEMKNITTSHQFGVCTLTLGSCMKSVNIPSSYIFLWLFFKLPVLTLLGLIIFPFVEKNIFVNNHQKIILGTIFLTIFSIIFLLIFFKVNLYDELRHILFLVPLILISSFSVFYFFSKKILLFISLFSILIFTIQNINIYPYQYTWFNSLSYFVNLNKNFELDYWGVSGRNIARKINTNKKILKYKDKCIYVAPFHTLEPFISNDYKCINFLQSIYPQSSEQYILVKYTRNIRKENPSNCELIFGESYKLNIFQEKLKLGEVYICN